MATSPAVTVRGVAWVMCCPVRKSSKKLPVLVLVMGQAQTGADGWGRAGGGNRRSRGRLVGSALLLIGSYPLSSIRSWRFRSVLRIRHPVVDVAWLQVLVARDEIVKPPSRQRCYI